MNILGADYSAGAFALVLLSGTRAEHSIVDLGVKKMALPDYLPSAGDLNAAVATLRTHIQTHSIDFIMLPQRQTKGQYSGSLSFFWEGVLMTSFGDKVRTVHAATAAATNKKQSDLKHYVKPKYLQKAYDVAFEGLD